MAKRQVRKIGEEILEGIREIKRGEIGRVTTPSPQNHLQSENDAQIRRVERELLDKEYSKFPLLRRDPTLAIGHLLKVVGDLWRDLGSARDSDQHGHRTLLELTLSGVGHCIRWINIFGTRELVLPPASWRSLDEEALDLLTWGTNYAQLTVDHVAWSRGLLEAHIDTANKVITFSNSSDIDGKFLLDQRADYQTSLTEVIAACPTQEMQRDFGRWRRRFRVIEGGFDYDESLARSLPSYPAIVVWLKGYVLPGVDEEYDLGGYSLIEFLCFFATLFINCTFWCWLEDSLDHVLGEEHDFGSSMLLLEERSMHQWLERMSGLRPTSVRSIVGALTFDISRLGSVITRQPIVPSPDRHLVLLPRLIALSDPNRLLAGAMNKGRGKLAYTRS